MPPDSYIGQYPNRAVIISDFVYTSTKWHPLILTLLNKTHYRVVTLTYTSRNICFLQQ